jgi:hypothetical protein
MKKSSLSSLLFAAIGILLIASVAQASLSANILYTETNLGSGLWQYDFVFQNTSLAGDTHPYLQSVKLDFENANVNMLNKPSGWTVYTFTGTAPIGTPVSTDYLEMWSDMMGADVLPGSSLGGFKFTADYHIGTIAYEAMFSNHAFPENFTSLTGTASAVPVPAAVWLLGSGLVGLAGFRRRLNTKGRL